MSEHPAIDYAHEHHERFLDEFKEFLRIPSVSTDPDYKDGIEAGAAFVVVELERLGFDNVAALPTDGQPVVVGEWLKAGPDNMTVLVYAHYDVQPVDDPEGLWESDPFEPTERDGRLIARGVADDKLGIWGNLKALEALLETTGELPLNVKVLFEGEEESGSPNMKPFVDVNHNLLVADLLIISDGCHRVEYPILTYSARGIIAAEVRVTGPEMDFHSGLGGGMINNPTHVVAQIIASFHDEKGNLAVAGAYNGVIPLTAEELAYFQAWEADSAADDRRMFGDFTVWGDPAYTLHERVTARPAIDVVGIYGGYQDEGFKTIIPAKAGFKVTMRLAPGQDPDAQKANLVRHIEQFDSETCPVSVELSPVAGPGFLMQHTGPMVEALERAFKIVWERPAERKRSGGSIPVIGMMQQALGIDMVALPMGVGGYVHAPNEWMLLDSIGPSIDVAIWFYDELGRLGVSS